MKVVGDLKGLIGEIAADYIGTNSESFRSNVPGPAGADGPIGPIGVGVHHLKGTSTTVIPVKSCAASNSASIAAKSIPDTCVIRSKLSLTCRTTSYLPSNSLVIANGLLAKLLDLIGIVYLLYM